MAVLSLAACKKNDGATVENKTTTTTEETTKQLEKEAATFDPEKLKGLTPATTAQLESVLPAEINGIPRDKSTPNAQKNVAVGMYMNMQDPTKMYSAMVADAAGMDLTQNKAELEKFKKMADDIKNNVNMSSEVINGNRVIFTDMDMGNGMKASGASLLYKGRYQITVSGSGLTKELAKDVISKMDLSKLP